MKKVYLLTHEYRPKRGGAGEVCEQLAKALVQQGHEAEVWAPESAKIISQEHLEYTLRPINGVKGSRNFGCLWAMGRQIIKRYEELRRSIVHLVDPGPIATMFYLQFFLRKPLPELIITLHGSEIVRYRRMPVSRWLFEKLAQKVTRFHVLSDYNEKALVEWIPSVKPKVVRAFGIEPIFQEDRSEALNDKDKIRILSVGRLHPRKGQLYLLQSLFEQNAEWLGKVELRFVGQPVKKAYVKSLQTLGRKLPCTVHLLQDLDDESLNREYANSDLFVMASVPYGASVEGLGLVYLEAFRYGLPVIAHNIGGVSDVVKDSENGFLVEYGDQEALLQAITKLVNEPQLRQQMGENGLKFSQSKSWVNVVRALYA